MKTQDSLTLSFEEYTNLFTQQSYYFTVNKDVNERIEKTQNTYFAYGYSFGVTASLFCGLLIWWVCSWGNKK